MNVNTFTSVAVVSLLVLAGAAGLVSAQSALEPAYNAGGFSGEFGNPVSTVMTTTVVGEDSIRVDVYDALPSEGLDLTDSGAWLTIGHGPTSTQPNTDLGRDSLVACYHDPIAVGDYSFVARGVFTITFHGCASDKLGETAWAHLSISGPDHVSAIENGASEGGQDLYATSPVGALWNADAAYNAAGFSGEFSNPFTTSIATTKLGSDTVRVDVSDARPKGDLDLAGSGAWLTIGYGSSSSTIDDGGQTSAVACSISPLSTEDYSVQAGVLTITFNGCNPEKFGPSTWAHLSISDARHEDAIPNGDEGKWQDLYATSPVGALWNADVDRRGDGFVAKITPLNSLRTAVGSTQMEPTIRGNYVFEVCAFLNGEPHKLTEYRLEFLTPKAGIESDGNDATQYSVGTYNNPTYLTNPLPGTDDCVKINLPARARGGDATGQFGQVALWIPFAPDGKHAFYSEAANARIDVMDLTGADVVDEARASGVELIPRRTSATGFGDLTSVEGISAFVAQTLGRLLP